MYKVVFIDDEFLIVEGLRKIINWESYGIMVAGTANSASEGIDLIKRISPDIVISDIKMDGASGLDMIERLRKSGYDGYTIILSGYQDFDYAQKAIEMHVYSYLLKPVNISKLKTIIEEIVEKLNSEKRRGKGIDKVLTYINNHFTEDISLTKIAEMNYFEVAYLSKMLKKKVGMTYTDYISKLRIELAKDYLINTDFSIEAIASAIGYKDDKYFRELFKKYEGVSPSKYRKAGSK